MTELEFIQSEQAKCEARLQRQLRKVDMTGWAGRETIETLLVNGLIDFGGPRTEINHPYNCYRLTTRGRNELAGR